ncbi:MAG: serpin family protein [Clostridia bacterium]
MKKTMIVITALILSAVMAACSTGGVPQTMKTTYAAEKSNDVISGNIDFAFDFFKELNIADRDENIFVSPFSISSALSMLYNGAAGRTRTDMAQALRYAGISDEEFNKGHRYLLDRLESLDGKVTIDINNSVWIRENFIVNPDFIQLSKNTFSAEVRSLDFSRMDATRIINEWVEEKTRGKIDQIIDRIDQDVVMYLINTIYFLGDWTYSFDKDKTADYAFKNYSGAVTDVDMMYLKTTLRYMDKDGFRAVRLPYGEGKTSMVILLPDEGTDINEFIKSLDRKKWEEILLGMQSHEDVLVRLPKFKMEYGIRNISSELISMGMGSAFSNADFSRIANNLEISRVLHKAVIEVDEKGTEAAAVTAVEIRLTSFIPDEKPRELIADRPFIYIITDDEDQSILFMGKMLQP